MFWIPGISLLVFFLILVPSTILGFKKGWRGAVFVSLLLLAFTGIWIGIGYLTYGSFLWPFYRDHILSKDLKVSGLNLNSLQETFKLRIVLVVAGILTPLSYLAVYIIWKLSSEKINKYMGPKTKEVSDYEKQVIYRKSTVASRTAGVTIMGATTLFISSLVASAVSVMTVPYSHRDGMTKFNDKLGSLYGFGQVGNTDTASALQSFMKEVDSEMIQALQEIAMIGTDGSQRTSTNNFKTDVSKVNSLLEGNNGMRWEVLKELMLDNHEAGAMFVKMALDSMHSSIENNPLKWDGPTNTDSRDAVGNQIGYGASRTFLLNDLKTYFQNANNKLKFSLTNEVINTFMDHFNKTITPFANTVFAKNKTDKEKDITDLKSELQSRKNKLAENEKKLESTQQENLKAVQRIVAINGQSYHATPENPTTGHSTTKTFSYDKQIMGTPLSTPNAGTLLANAIHDRNVARDLLNHFKLNKYNPAENLMKASQRALEALDPTKTNFEAIVSDAQARVQSATSALNSLKYQLNDATARKNNAESQKRRNLSTIQQKQTTITSNTQTIATLQANIRTLDSAIQTLNSDITTLSGTISNKEAAIQTAESSLVGLTDKDQIAAINAQINSLRTEVNNLNVQKNNKNTELNAKTTERQSLSSRIGTLSSANTSLQSEISSLNTENGNLDSTISTTTNEIDTLNGTGAGSIKVAQDNLKSENTSLASARSDLDSFMNSQYNPALNKRNRDKKAFEDLIPKLNSLTTDLHNKDDQILKFNNELSELKTKITNNNDDLDHMALEMVALLADKVTWDPSTQTNTPHTDDNSISFSEKELAYQEVVLKNIEVIYNAKLKIYNSNKKELISIYSKWLRGQ